MNALQCIQVALLLAQVEGRVHVFKQFSQLLATGTPSSRTVAVQSDTPAHHEPCTTETFSSIPHVEDLYIVNKLSSLATCAFVDLKHLRSLTLEENKLPTLNANDFSGLRLATLRLIDNNISALSTEAFANSSIDRIDISCNCLAQIPARAFDDASPTQLSLAHNRISRIAEHALCTSLVWLDLSDNRIRDVPITIFENLFALRHLNVSRNLLPTLTSGLWLRSLEVLDASYNRIRLLVNGAFEDYPMLRLLKLDHNELLYLNPASFVKPSPIVELHVEHNMLAFLPPDTADIFSNLRLLRYGGNPWHCACLAAIELFVKHANVQRDACEKEFFVDGGQPVCITAYSTCFHNETLLVLEDPAALASLLAGYHC